MIEHPSALVMSAASYLIYADVHDSDVTSYMCIEQGIRWSSVALQHHIRVRYFEPHWQGLAAVDGVGGCRRMRC